MHRKQPIFIVGCPRSGTTLLASRLDRHSRIAVTPESHFFEILSNRFLVRIRYRLTPRGVWNLLHKTRMKDLQIDYGDFRNAFLQTRQRYVDIFDTCMELYRLRERKVFWCEKTPQHLKHYSLIFHFYPNAKIICIIRDGRDVALSLSRTSWRERNLATASLEWNEYADAYFALNTNPKYKGNCHAVKFEDLLETPRCVLKDICDFLHVDFESEIVSPPERKPVLLPEWELSWKKNILEDFNQDISGKWCRQANDFEKVLMNSIMEKNLKRLGYNSVLMDEVFRRDAKINLDILIGKCMKPVLDSLERHSRFRQKKYHFL